MQPIQPDCLECESKDCAYNRDGICRFSKVFDRGPSITVEDGCGISGATLVCVNGIHIGRHTLIGADTLILDNDMHYPRSGASWGSTWGNPGHGKPIHIGEGCFIGTRAIILKGVTIGSGAVVAAGAVVTRDVPSGCLAIGNPAENKPLPERLRHPEKS